MDNNSAVTFHLIKRVKKIYAKKNHVMAGMIGDIIYELNHRSASDGISLIPYLFDTGDPVATFVGRKILRKIGKNSFHALINYGVSDGSGTGGEVCGEILTELIRENMGIGYVVAIYKKYSESDKSSDLVKRMFIVKAVSDSGQQGQMQVRNFKKRMKDKIKKAPSKIGKSSLRAEREVVSMLLRDVENYSASHSSQNRLRDKDLSKEPDEKIAKTKADSMMSMLISSVKLNRGVKVLVFDLGAGNGEMKNTVMSIVETDIARVKENDI